MAENLTPRQRKAVEALLTTGDKSQAAEQAGVSRETLYKWLKQPAFQSTLRAAEAEAISNLSKTLLRLAQDAAKVFAQSLRVDNESVRLRAANLILQRLLQVRELIDLEARISAIEERFDDGQDV